MNLINFGIVRLAVLVCALIVAAGQSVDQPGARFTLDTTLVLIPVSVTDSMNRFVLGLPKTDFRVYEDGTEQTITNF